MQLLSTIVQACESDVAVLQLGHMIVNLKKKNICFSNVLFALHSLHQTWKTGKMFCLFVCLFLAVQKYAISNFQNYIKLFFPRISNFKCIHLKTVNISNF